MQPSCSALAITLNSRYVLRLAPGFPKAAAGWASLGRQASNMANAKLKLGDTEVTRIGLGTNRLTNTSEHIAFVREAVTAGVSHIDTAHSYTGGESEETIGAALSPLSDGYVLATKGGYRAGEGNRTLARSKSNSATASSRL
jgi:aryl-alcohol dehydrogenase-like predicted oxidoreductase